MKKITVFLIIALLMVFGCSKFLHKDIVSDIEGILMIAASYTLLFIGSKAGILPNKVNKVVKWFTDISEND